MDSILLSRAMDPAQPSAQVLSMTRLQGGFRAASRLQLTLPSPCELPISKG